MLEKMDENASFRSLLWTSDEAHFHLEGKVNSKKCSGEVGSPLRLPRHPYIQRNVVWAAISERGISGQFFFEEHGAQIIVTKERYVEVL